MYIIWAKTSVYHPTCDEAAGAISLRKKGLCAQENSGSPLLPRCREFPITSHPLSRKTGPLLLVHHLIELASNMHDKPSPGVSSLGVPGGAMAFADQLNAISIREIDRLCPPNYYWHPQIFRPADGPEATRQGLKKKAA